MKRIHRKTVLLSALAAVVIAFILAIFLLWPVMRSASSVKRLEDGLYAMEYSGDFRLEDFIAQGGGNNDMAVADFVIDRLFHGLLNLDLHGHDDPLRFGGYHRKGRCSGVHQLFRH